MSDTAFLEDMQENRTVFNNDYTKAKKYPAIGDAMKAAAEINGSHDKSLVIVISLG